MTDAFAIANDWDLELNIGVASGSVRSSIVCIYRDSAHPYTEQEITLCQALAKQLALATTTTPSPNKPATPASSKNATGSPATFITLSPNPSPAS